MTWHDDRTGTFTEWAVELTYNDGEKRYRSDDYGEAEARTEAERSQFQASMADESDSHPVSARAVSRQVTYGAWT